MVNFTGSSDALIGSTLAHYVIEAQLSGQVYRGYHAASKRPVAVKILPADYPHKSDFLTEKSRLATLEHPHILPILAVGEYEYHPYVVTPFIEGSTLRDVLANDLLAYREVTHVMMQAAAALDYAHDRGVLHRNLRPANILVDQYVNLYITDFGLPLAEPGLYTAPEEWLGDRVDYRVDVYALGVLLFEMLTGEPPFRGDNLREQHLHDVPPLPIRAGESAGYVMDEAVNRALAKKTNERFLRAGDLARAVEKSVRTWFGGETISVLPDSSGRRMVWDVLWEPAEEQEQQLMSVSAVRGCAWLGEDFLSAGDDGFVYRWSDGESERLVKTGSRILSLSIDEEGQKFATAHDDGIVRVWDIRGDLLHVFQGHQGGALCCSLSGNGMMLATGGEDRTLRIWDLMLGHEYRVMYHEGAVLDCSMNVNGQLVLSACEDRVVRLWHTQTGQALQTFVGHHAAVTACELKGELVFSGSADGVLRVWDILMEDDPLELRGHNDAITDCHIQEVENMILGASSAQDGEVRLWNLRESVTLRHYTSGQDAVLCCALNEDQVLSGDTAGILRLYSHQLTPAPHKHQGRIQDSWLDSGVVISAGRDFTLNHTSLARGEHLFDLTLESHPRCVTVFEQFTLVGGDDGMLRCLEPEMLHWETQAHQAEVNFVMVLDEQRVVSGGADGTLCVWNLENGVRLSAVAPRTANLRCGLIYRGLVIVGTQEGEVAAWDPMSGIRRRLFGDFKQPVMACSLGRRTLAVGLANGQICHWQADVDKSVSIFQGHEATITTVTVSRDGQLLVSADVNRLVQVWDLGEQVRLDHWEVDSPVSHMRWVDLQRLLVGHEDGSLRCLSWR